MRIGYDLSTLIIEDDDIKLSIDFYRLEDIARMIRALRIIGRHLSGKMLNKIYTIFNKTVATVPLDIIEELPTCLGEIGKETLRCKWAHDFNSFIRQVEEELEHDI